jgi:hypothetical protein
MKYYLLFMLILVMSTLVWSESVEIKPIKVIKGSIAEVALQKNCPEFIADAVSMNELWQSWKIKGKVPEIDFSKQIVLVSTTVGSVMNLTVTLDEKGDMKTIGMSSMDFGEGFRYLMQIVSREGVKTVNGKTLPTTRKILPVVIYKGSILDMKKLRNSQDVITGLQPFKDLWTSWKFSEKLPEVDFTKQIAVITTGMGSILYSSYVVDINGNLKVDAMQTKDIAEGFRYQIAIINLDGIKTINGKEIPK